MSSVAEPDDSIDEIVERAGRALRVVSPAEIDGAAHTDAPQGVVASAEPLPDVDLTTLLLEPAAFLVALDGITDPRNLGAVVRCAETAGATGVVVPRHRSARFTPSAVKASAGAVEHIPIASVGGVPGALDRARRRGVWTVGLDEAADTTIDALTVATESLVLVFGAEGHGLSKLTARRCDVMAAIPMRGQVPSLNVAAAACIACHEVARHRYE